MKTLTIKVKESDIHRAYRDPTVCPISLAVSRNFRESLENVDVQKNGVYIWDEYDSYSSVYSYTDDSVTGFITEWQEQCLNESIVQDDFEPFEIQLAKRNK